MKKLLALFLSCILYASVSVAQAPEKFNYQGVARDNSGNVLANQGIGLQIKLRWGGQNGFVDYQETHSTSTNQFGLFTIEIGAGNVQAGVFSTIDWGNTPLYYLEVLMDATGGTNYATMGGQQLNSVPYALNAKSSASTSAVSGTTNYISKFTPNGNNIGSSRIIDDGYYVGIGNPTPVWDLNLHNTSTQNFFHVTNTSTGISEGDGLLLGLANSGGDAILSNQETGKYLAFGTAATERIRIKSDGYVGIGTTSPTNFLHVHGPSSSAIQFTTPGTGTGATDGVQLGIGVASTYLVTYENTDFAIGNAYNSGEEIYIKANGYVGIGTSGPVHKLQVVDAAAGATAVYAENTYVGNADGTGVTGKSRNNGYYGTGVSGEGGYIGVSGYGNGGSATQSVYAVYGYADGTAGTRYGVYGTATGGTTNYGVYCSGNGGYSGTWTQISDEKFKTDVTPLNSALTLVNKLNPVSYQLKTKEYPMMNFPDARQYGFIAQELEQVIPLLVESGSHPGATKQDQDIQLKAVNYIGMVPVLTKAIQEQQLIIEELKAELQQQREEIQELKK